MSTELKDWISMLGLIIVIIIIGVLSYNQTPLLSSEHKPSRIVATTIYMGKMPCVYAYDESSSFRTAMTCDWSKFNGR